MMDNPTTTQGTPEAVRALEREAMRLYREAHPNGPPWQELIDHTRVMWVVLEAMTAEPEMREGACSIAIEALRERLEANK